MTAGLQRSSTDGGVGSNYNADKTHSHGEFTLVMLALQWITTDQSHSDWSTVRVHFR
jgi:hypothetical protein